MIYINAIKELFENNGLHPDEDLKLAYGAKKVYGSSGGYAELLELLNNPA